MNDLDKYGILITDIIKEIFILLLALSILLNFSIQLENNPNILELKKYEDVSHCGFQYDLNEVNKSNQINFFICNVNNGLMDMSQNINVLKNTNVLYVIYILSMYFFIYLISKINVNKQQSWRSVFNDFINKLTYILLFPFIIITMIYYLYVGLRMISILAETYGVFLTDYIYGLVLLIIFIYGLFLFLLIFTIYSIVFIYSRDNIQYIVNANRMDKNKFIEKYKYAYYNGIFNKGVIDKGSIGELYDDCISEGKNGYLFIVKTMNLFIGGLSEHNKLLNNNETSKSIVFIIFNYIFLFLFTIGMFVLLSSGLHKIVGFSIYNTIGIVFNITPIFNKLWCADVDMKKMHMGIKIIIGALIVYNIYVMFSLLHFAFAVIIFIIMIILLVKKYNNFEVDSCEKIIL